MKVHVIQGTRKNKGNCTVVYKDAAKWPVYWEQSENRTIKNSEKRCDQVTPKEIYECLEKSGAENKTKHQEKKTGSCLSYVNNLMRDCCLVREDAIYNDPFAEPIGLPWWVPLVAPPLY